MHKSFYNALLNTDSVLPKGLVSWNKTNCERRFAVYRNNVVVSLIDALAVNFPVVQHLVGEVFFRAMAREFVSQFPPKTPVMAFYGEDFADFIMAFPPAASIAYLADIAKLEYAIQLSRHSADSSPLATAKLLHLIEDHQAMASTGLKLAASAEVITSTFPIASIWYAHQGKPPFDLSQIQLDQSEAVFLSRPGLEVELHSIDQRTAKFITKLNQAFPLLAAAETTHPFDLTAALKLLIQQQAIIGLITASLTTKVSDHEFYH